MPAVPLANWLARASPEPQSMSATPSPGFLADLAKVYATVSPEAFSAAFVSDLKRAYGALPVVSDDNLQLLAAHFDIWRKKTQELVRTRVDALPDDDPFKCRISLFRTMDAGRLEVAR
jgi:hypothetical protein